VPDSTITPDVLDDRISVDSVANCQLPDQHSRLIIGYQLFDFRWTQPVVDLFCTTVNYWPWFRGHLD